MTDSKQMTSSTSDSSINPRVELLSNLKDDELKFTLSGVNVSIANAIRRIILSEIPIVVFRVSPNEKNKCNITANTSGLNNEIVKHRLSCVPIHIKDVEEFPLKNYKLELHVENNTDTTMYVTTKDFVIRDLVSGKSLPEEKIREIFPANDITGDFIDFVRLKAKPSDDIQAKSIHLTCEFDIGTAKEDSAYNVVSTCSYGNTIDTALQEATLQQLKQKWKDEGKNESEIEFEAKNWKLLEGKRIFLKDSFDFVIQTIGIHSNQELLVMACKIMINKLDNLDSLIDKDELEIKRSENTMKNSFDITLENEDYTIGKVIEYFLYKNLYENNILTFCGFEMTHPHNSYSTIRVAYKDSVEISTIKGHLKECISNSNDVFRKIRKEFLKLVPR
jgi:DNA-directed RNA polymerase subunit L/DNA-directed RNA polymerase alpha subunit